MRYLGIDYGSKRTGIAISDETLTVAFPYKTIPTTKTLAEDILEILHAEKIVKVVLGESKNLDMKDNPIMKGISILKSQLEEKGVEVDFHPEFYTSAQVMSVMGEQNKSIDASAAAIILQNYLDLQKHI